MKIQTISFIALALTGAVSSQANVLMFDFGSTAITNVINATNSPYHSIDSSFSNTNWTQVTGDLTNGVIWSDGTSATGVTIDVGRTLDFGATVLLLDQSVSSTVGTALSAGIYDGPGKDSIFATAANSGNARYVGTQISGLSAGSYTVYVSGRNGNTTSAGSQKFFAGTSTNGNFDVVGYATQTITNAVSNPSSWEGYYASFTVDLSEGEALNIASIGTSGDMRGFLNTLQIVPGSSTPTNNPNLVISSSVSAGSFIISWPSSYGAAFNVMTNADLTNTNGWGNTGLSATLVGNTYEVTNSIGNEAALFYKLEGQ
jgi:hypothetical protein